MPRQPSPYYQRFGLPIGNIEEAVLARLTLHALEEKPFPSVTGLVDLDVCSSRGRASEVMRRLETKGAIGRGSTVWEDGYLTDLGWSMGAFALDRVQRGAGIPPASTCINRHAWRPEHGDHTVWPKAVRQVPTGERGENVLRAGRNVKKLGGQVTKGRLRGAVIRFLSLEERATCPTSCAMWVNCYGNNMPFAIRYQAGPELEARIEKELVRFGSRQRRPMLLRLHELGDFYSPEYVAFWGEQLARFEWLNIFGFTAWAPRSPIGRAVEDVRQGFGNRFAIRWSASEGTMGAFVIPRGESRTPKHTFRCPEQGGRVSNCGACGACWATDRAVGFGEH